MKGVVIISIIGILCLYILFMGNKRHDLDKENKTLKKTIVDLKEEITEYRDVEIMKTKCRECGEGMDKIIITTGVATPEKDFAHVTGFQCPRCNKIFTQDKFN